MFRAVFTQNLKWRFRKTTTYLYFLIFTSIGFFVMLFAGGAFPGVQFHFADAGTGKVMADAPYVLYYLINIVGAYGVLLTAAIFGAVGFRDFKENYYSYGFTYPVRKIPYILGKFSASFITVLFIFSGTGFGAFLGSHNHFVDPAKIGNPGLFSFIQPYLIGVVPNILFAGVLFFSLALLSRKIFPVYVGSTFLVMGYMLAFQLVKNLDSKTIAAVIDPFGIIAALEHFKYWSIAEKNSNLIPFSSSLFSNRIIWIVAAIVILSWAIYRFKFKFEHSTVSGKLNRDDHKLLQDEASESPGLLPIKAVPNYGIIADIKRIIRIALIELKMLTRNIYFLSILLFAFLFMMISGLKSIGMIQGTRTYPVTYQVLDISAGKFFLFLMIIVIFFAGELIWRERDKKTQQIFDACPSKNYVLYMGKTIVLFLVQFLLMFFIMVGSIIVQISLGYYHFEIGLYIRELFIFRLSFFLFISVLTIFFQVIANKKYLGHSLIVLYLIFEDLLPMLGIRNDLFRFGHIPEYIYSDMNGYGPYLHPLLVFMVYWSFFSMFLGVLTILFWVRGNETGFKFRLRHTISRFNGGIKKLGYASLILWFFVGVYIFYNTNILNAFQTEDDINYRSVLYEKRYKGFENLPSPRITGMKLDVSIFPESRVVEISGDMILKNKSDQPISKFLVFLNPDVYLHTLNLSVPNSILKKDKETGVVILTLNEPLDDNVEIALTFKARMKEKGFKSANLNTNLVHNGTFLRETHLIPMIGYSRNLELEKASERKSYGLVKRPLALPIDDPVGLHRNYVSTDADWIDYEATLSTSKGQIALTPGDLIKTWEDKDRRYFHYKSPHQVLNFICFISAQYEIKKDRWNDVDIEVYYHPTHSYNIGRFIESTKLSLDYFSKNFGPYPLKHLRIVEFPRYATFATSFPGLIPYSEGAGFISRPREGDVDYVFDSTSHEIAHQWWGHQVIGADVMGYPVTSEVLAQYSSMMVTSKKYSSDLLNEYAKYELDRYLRGRANEKNMEEPLYLSHEQGYIYYGKGYIVMRNLLGLMGEENLNKALSIFNNRFKYSSNPYPTSEDFVNIIKQFASPEIYSAIDEMFKEIVLWDVSLKNGFYEKNKDGMYTLHVNLDVKKTIADGSGNEKEAVVDDFLFIGVYGGDDNLISAEKVRVKSTENGITLLVNETPAKITVDPFYYLVERDRNNNSIKLDRKE
ncbi:MAG: ABC transporter permease [Acidobacteria bacterium]|nr:ABC transporter permease [Acidobacteriota bacterium]